MSTSSPRLPPRWFVRAFWIGHRALYSITRGRLGLRRPRPGRWGMLRLRTIGRRTGAPHNVIVAHLEDGPDLVLMAMNGWAEPMPAWWLNLRARPDTVVDLPGGSARPVSAHQARDEEHSRLWRLWQEVDENLDGYAARRTETPLVVLTPRGGSTA